MPGQGACDGVPSTPGADQKTYAVWRPPVAGLSGFLTVTRFLAGTAVTRREARAQFVHLTLVLAPIEAGEPVHTILLQHRDPAQDLVLCQVHDCEAIALWRAIGHELGLPLSVEDEHGTTLLASHSIGALTCRSMVERRGARITTHRRARFLRRRKTARLPLNPVVHCA
jgi:hypothetical protein